MLSELPVPLLQVFRVALFSFYTAFSTCLVRYAKSQDFSVVFLQCLCHYLGKQSCTLVCLQSSKLTIRFLAFLNLLHQFLHGLGSHLCAQVPVKGWRPATLLHVAQHIYSTAEDPCPFLRVQVIDEVRRVVLVGFLVAQHQATFDTIFDLGCHVSDITLQQKRYVHVIVTHGWDLTLVGKDVNVTIKVAQSHCEGQGVPPRRLGSLSMAIATFEVTWGKSNVAQVERPRSSISLPYL